MAAPSNGAKRLSKCEIFYEVKESARVIRGQATMTTLTLFNFILRENINRNTLHKFNLTNNISVSLSSSHNKLS